MGSMKTSIIGAVAVVIIVLALGGAYFFFTSIKHATSQSTNTNNNSSQNMTAAVIAGTLDLNGYIPANSTITIETKKLQDSSYQSVATNVSAKDGGSWTFANGVAGQDYMVKADLVVSGKTTDSSDPVTVAAPASAVVLRINSSAHPPAPKVATVSGVLDLNGYIPPSSTISISAKKSGGAYQVVATGTPAKDQGGWVWNNAEDGVTYTLKGTLVSNGSNIVDSSEETVTAPASNELIVINSTAKPPAPTVVRISGTTTFNGSIPGGSTFSLGVRKSGTAQFNNVVSGVSATNGMAWTYNSASPGQSYDIQGYLWTSGKPYSQSQVLTVQAPAANESLTINAQLPPPSPAGGTISVSCGPQQNNLYQATINFNTQNNLQNPQQFQVMVGSSSGGSDVYNSTVAPNNPKNSQSLTTNYLFSKAVNYYASYSYANCQGNGCGTFSSASPSFAFNCQN